MKLKIFQLNTWAGKFLPEIISFIKQHDFDILLFQELAHGHWIKKFPSEHNFERLTAALQSSHQGLLATTKTFSNIPGSYFGNGIFFRKSYTVLNSQTIWLAPFDKFTYGDPFFQRPMENDPVTALSITLQIGEKSIEFINTHMMWGPNPYDQSYKIDQAKKLVTYIKTVPHPFVLTGDFNVLPQTQAMKIISAVGTNLTVKHQLKTTLNPPYTKAPEPYPIDAIIISPQLRETSFKLIDTPALSDHYGLTAEIVI